jgi:hypothetical protein
MSSQEKTTCNVEELWRAVEGYPVLTVKTSKLKFSFDPCCWVDDWNEEQTTPKDWCTPAWIIEHADRIKLADLQWPIVIKSRGWTILDGHHRLARALLEGFPTINVVRAGPEFDHVTQVVQNTQRVIK